MVFPLKVRFMNRSLSVFCVLIISALAPLGCTPESSTKVGEMGKGMADTAKEVAGDAAKASGMSDLLGKATEALSSVEGGADMLKNVKDSFGKITETLKGVTDSSSASSALPEITKLTETFGGMTEMFGKLPESAKSAVAGVFTSAVGELKPMLEKIMAIPGVESVLKPAIDALMAKLGTFKA